MGGLIIFVDVCSVAADRRLSASRTSAASRALEASLAPRIRVIFDIVGSTETPAVKLATQVQEMAKDTNSPLYHGFVTRSMDPMAEVIQVTDDRATVVGGLRSKCAWRSDQHLGSADGRPNVKLAIPEGTRRAGVEL